MKRYGYLFERAFSKENLYQAYVDASQNKHNKRSCFNFERRLAHNLDLLYDTLHDGSYKPKPYYVFTVCEPKERLIFAPAFSDLVVQHAIYRIIYPIFNATFIDQSFACRKGKGTHKAADYAQGALQKSPAGSYTIKLDIRKFFYRIDRAVLRSQIERKIKDKRLVDIMMVFAEYGQPVGIPIGNLLSQTYALIYLNALDHFVKRELKAKRYCRYVDDFILFGLSKDKCLEALEKIKTFLVSLKLELSKYSLAAVNRGLNFVGYRTWASKRFIRKHSMFKFARAVRRENFESVVSTLGHARRTHSLRHLVKTIKNKRPSLFARLPVVYKRHGLQMA